MTGLMRFLRKELVEIGRTWRMWVLPGLIVFFAVTSPLIAKITPSLLESVARSQPGVVIRIPEPTYVDSYAQWVKNLQQLVTFALLITTGGLVAAERSSGTAVLVLTKPVSRTAFVVAKAVAQTALLCVSTILGTALVWGVTLAMFGEAPVGRLLSATGAWLAFAVLLVGVMTLLSSALSTLAAAGAGIAAFFALSLLALWGPTLRYSPAGLLAAPSSLLAGEDVALAWPLVTGAMTMVLLIATAAWVFDRREL